MLGRLATAIAEQVERYRDSEMQKLMVQAELRALQSQINPHFLFNALNTLFGIIPREASGARRTVLNLADIFRYSPADSGEADQSVRGDGDRPRLPGDRKTASGPPSASRN